ncbi:MAG: alpha-glucan family phosphorylase [Anaerolineales bacterium]|nr:alpha-glucan family phosphorylase [Anaerolineales bacterium]MBP6209861.1 alpha-glucan family phosphorylase [Anaerolineales bacterium]MBP8164645.1 alpha-glucan family phosphorylase [Anaerolineales bacterium]
MEFLTSPSKKFNLPKRIARLGELAYNLWWTWHPEAARLFGRLDYDLWERIGHNPIRLLEEIDQEQLKLISKEKDYLALYDALFGNFDSYFTNESWSGKNHPGLKDPVAYFSMEFGLHETLPIYSGGLGVLAGDHLKEASDLGLPLVAVGFMYGQGYFSQRISEDGWQEALNNPLTFDHLPVTLVTKDNKPVIIQIEFPDRSLSAQIWEVRVGRVPLYLLDSNVDGNSEYDRLLTARLYWSDLDRRVMQEALLGIGGVRALRALGFKPAVWHMNEGHASFLTLERAREFVASGSTFAEAAKKTISQNVFTTHTPVPAGNDEFPLWLIDKYFATFWPALGLSREEFIDLARHHQPYGDSFSMPVLALKLSNGSNGVSELHGQVSRDMWNFLWPEKKVNDVPIKHITNGVHTANWMARRMNNLFEKHLGGDWYEHLDEPAYWSKLDNVPDAELWSVRLHQKRKLAFYMRERVRDRWTRGGFHPVQVVSSGVLINPYALTIGFARRFATYKRASLILSDIERLLEIINRPNMPVQIIFAGKAHPADEPGKQLIQKVYRTVKKAETGGRLVFLEDYDMNLARYLVQGVDVWMNTPRRPYEASGTSGMKAAINGALNFSVLDGWWREAYNGRNGWAIGEDKEYESNDAQDDFDAKDLYNTLENKIIPLYYDRDPKEISHEWIAMMKDTMKTIIPQFSTRRMVKEYIETFYAPAADA